MPTVAWSEAKIRDLKPEPRDRLVSLGDCLYARVRQTGRKTFVVRRRKGAAWKVDTLGDWPAMTLQRARGLALTADTVEPPDKKTFGKAADLFCDEMIRARYRSSPEETTAYLTRDCASLWHVQMARLTRGQLIEVVKAKAATPNGARKLLAILKQFSRWAVMHEMMQVDLMGVVSASNIGLPPPAARDRVLTDDEIKAVMTAEGNDARILRFCLSTATRIGETLQFNPGQVDGTTWTIPETKNGKEHRLHLTPLALEQLPFTSCPYVSLHGRTRPTRAWNLHDLRRTAASLMRAGGVSVDDVEAVLNHAPRGGSLVRVYQRQDTLPAIKAALEVLERQLKAVVAK
jgi:integrase